MPEHSTGYNEVSFERSTRVASGRGNSVITEYTDNRRENTDFNARGLERTDIIAATGFFRLG